MREQIGFGEKYNMAYEKKERALTEKELARQN